MTSHLEQILAATRRRVQQHKTVSASRDLERAAAEHTPRGFARSLREAAQSGPAIIAELKRASPSRGLIRADFDPASLAHSLAQGGAAALSVLTEEQFFQGSLRNLELASGACILPCLRKDFMIDEFQLLEARAHRADAILLIVAALNNDELTALTRAAHALELDVLCEVHTAGELQRVLDLDPGCDAVGVNNRDLKSFNVTLDVSLSLAERLPPGAVRVAESGIHSAADLVRLREAGFHAFLMGESLMRQADPGSALAQLMIQARSLTAVPAGK